MTGPLPSENYFHASMHSPALPASETGRSEAVVPPHSPPLQSKFIEVQSPQSQKACKRILNFLRDPQNQASTPATKKAGSTEAGAKKMDVSTGVKSMDLSAGAAPAEIAYDPATGLYLDTVTGALIDPSTGLNIDPVTGQLYDPAAVGGYPGGYPRGHGAGYINPAMTGYLDPSFIYAMGGHGDYNTSTPGYFPQNPGGGLDYASLGYVDPAAPAAPQPTQQAPEQTHSAPTQEDSPTPSETNTNAANVGDGNDTLVIPAKVDSDADKETQNQQREALKKLVKDSDILDMGFGNNELTIEADDRRGTVKFTNCGAADIVYIKGKNNVLTIETDKRKKDSEHSQDKVVLSGNSEDWELKKNADGSTIYTNKSTGNKITVKGDAEVVTDDCGEIKDPEAPISDEDKIPADFKLKLEKMSAKEIATQIDMDKLGKDEEEKKLLQDYVALKYVLCMDNDFSGASEDTFFWWGDDLTDNTFSQQDLDRCIGAARPVNPVLAAKVQQLLDKRPELTMLDNGDGASWRNTNYSRSELEKILDGIKNGSTLDSLAKQGAKLSDDDVSESEAK